MAMRGEPVAIGADAPLSLRPAFHAVQRARRRLGDQARKIERAARLRPGARQPRAAERLHADRRADDVAVDVDVAGLDAFDHARDRLVDARVEAEGEAVAGGVDVVDQFVERLALDSAAHAAPARTPRARRRRFLFTSISVGGTNVPRAALSPSGVWVTSWPRPRIVSMWLDDRVARFRGDHRADVDRELARIADLELGHRALQHVEHAVGDIVLQAEDAQGRTALAGRIESRRQDVDDDLFGERRGIDHHRVEAAGLGDEGQGRAAAGEAARRAPFRSARATGVEPVKTTP